MADPSLFDALRIPSDVLVALDNRTYHFALQPYHYIVRLIHVLSMGAFFGGIAVLDLQLIGAKRKVPLRALADFVLPFVYLTFAVTMITGVMLFLYEPVKVGAHAYFMPKLLLTVLGIGNAALFNGRNFNQGIHLGDSPALRSKIAGIVSLALWTGVIIFACMNVEGIPKRYLLG